MDLSDYNGVSSAAARSDHSKLFQAYIISGQGSGKTSLAKHIAARAVCSDSEHAACGRCSDCRKAEAGIHPDIIWIEPPENEKEYKDYQIDTIRNMCAESAVFPNEARRKVYIITDGAKLSDACQNVLLKTLEEPASHAVFIIITENSGSLLITVRSRCVELNLAPKRDDALCPENVRNLASGLMDALSSQNSLTIAEYLFSLESISKADMTDLSGEMLRCCTAAIGRNSAGDDCGIPTEKLLKIAEIFKEARKYLEFNVSIGHIIGLLTAEIL